MAKSIDSPQFRSQRGRLGAYVSWAKTEDRAARTAAARRALMDRFEKEVDPEGTLSLQERTKRAEFARKAYFQRLAIKSTAARQRRKLICQECGQPKEAETPRCPTCLRKLRE